jgi:aminoglycoside phosphotransferase family enzyme
MEKKQIQELIDHCRFNDTCKNASLIETHISWIVLTDRYAYKIKRPVKYSFVDFSTLELREHFCHLELKLNRRLAPDMYLEVVPVTAKGIMENRDTKKQEIIDYAVKMKRMDNSRRMDKLLKKGKVELEDIEKIAKTLVRFHKNTEIVKNPFNTLEFHEKYKDILSIGDYITDHFGAETLKSVREAVNKSYLYLNLNRNLMNHRIINNYQRDCHGDLNSTNIFLYDEPVIFDCIDFNKEYRVIDLLNEIAFLTVDLDFYDQSLLGHHFFTTYREEFGEEMDGQIGCLFNYYKSYRANIRAKVTAINSVKNNNKNNKSKEVKTYLDLMLTYIGKLKLKPTRNKQHIQPG